MDDPTPSAPESVLLRTLIETMPDFIFAKDLRGRFLLCNPTCAHSLGADSPEEVIGKTDADFLAPEYAHKYAEDERKVVESREPLLDIEERFRGPDGGERWMLTSKVPVFDDDGRVVGTLGVARDVTVRHELVDSLNRQTMELRHRNREIEGGLEVAERFWQSMVPEHPPEVPELPGAHFALDVHQLYQPSAGLGGDFFNVRVLDDGRVGVLVCDVTGHDVRSALLAATVNGLKEHLRSQAGQAGPYMNALNKRLVAILESTSREVFVTAFYVVVDPFTSSVAGVRAGHPKALVRRKSGAVEVLGLTGPALGLRGDAAFEADQKTLKPGDGVLLFTDGLLEAVDDQGHEFGMQGLEKALQTAGESAGDEVLTRLMDAVKAFSSSGKLDDDACAVWLACRNPQSDG